MEFYHLINRGVDKRQVFMDDGDYQRFIHDMYVFNDAGSAPNYITKERESERKRDLLIRIHAFVLMPNHYHFLVSPLTETGISLFMRKLNMGYAKYFNEKYERSGVLWQGTFRKVPVKRDAHFMYLPYYLHLNPLDLTHPQWRTGNVQNQQDALDVLQTYRWSSYLDYNNTRNFPSLLYMAVMQGLVGTSENQQKEIKSIISNRDLAASSEALELA